MNKQTRSLRKVNKSLKVGKGVAVPKVLGNGGHCADAHFKAECLVWVTFPSTDGTSVNSSAERKASGRKPWRGLGDPLKRGAVVYPKYG